MNRQKIIIFLISFMLRILFPQLLTNMRRCGSAMMAVGHIGKWNFIAENIFDSLNIGYFRNKPQSMFNPVRGCKIILGLFAYNSFNNSIDSRIIRVCEENRFGIKISNPDMIFPVFLLIRTCQFVFSNSIIQIIMYTCATYQTILRFVP